eukprot:m.107879 g.107879  ORF g.107879 m.107879 type:complete len:354 (-) comp16932_c0_seq1:136-1197(-)
MESTSERQAHETASMPRKIAIIVHGGAWAIPDSLEARSRAGCKNAARTGYDILVDGGTAMDAVESAVRVLENDDVFDAGTGSVLNADGEVEMDAMIMDGETLNTGAVAALPGVANPISVAREVMDRTGHCLLVGQGAQKFADMWGHRTVPVDRLVTSGARAEYEAYKDGSYATPVADLFNGSDAAGHDTVGAVAVDDQGHVACATSTGGITMKRPGRVGDSPLVGCGGYADDLRGAVSATGHGESLMRWGAALRCLADLEQRQDAARAAGVACDADACAAAEHTLQGMLQRTGGRGGLIVVTRTGDVGCFATTPRMVWASAKGLPGQTEPHMCVGFEQADCTAQKTAMNDLKR